MFPKDKQLAISQLKVLYAKAFQNHRLFTQALYTLPTWEQPYYRVGADPTRAIEEILTDVNFLSDCYEKFESANAVDDMTQGIEERKRCLQLKWTLLSRYIQIAVFAAQRYQILCPSSKEKAYYLVGYCVPMPYFGRIEVERQNQPRLKLYLTSEDAPPSPANLLSWMAQSSLSDQEREWVMEVLTSWALSAGTYPCKGYIDSESWGTDLCSVFHEIPVAIERTVIRQRDTLDLGGLKGSEVRQMLEQVGNDLYSLCRRNALNASRLYRKALSPPAKTEKLSPGRIQREERHARQRLIDDAIAHRSAEELSLASSRSEKNVLSHGVS